MSSGAPTKYQAKYNKQAQKLCKLGATDEELADFFEVSVATINNWKNEHPRFLESIKKGKVLADAEVAERLYQRAIGYEHDAEEIKVVPQIAARTPRDPEDVEENEDPLERAGIVRVPIKKIYPPDTAAAIFWLKNRQKKKWRDKVETGLTNNDGDDVNPVTIFQIPDNGRDKHNTASTGVPDDGSEQPG